MKKEDILKEVLHKIETTINIEYTLPPNPTGKFSTPQGFEFLVVDNNSKSEYKNNWELDSLDDAINILSEIKKERPENAIDIDEITNKKEKYNSMSKPLFLCMVSRRNTT